MGMETNFVKKKSLNFAKDMFYKSTYIKKAIYIIMVDVELYSHGIAPL